MKIIAKQDLETLGAKKGQEITVSPAIASALIAHGYAIAASASAPVSEPVIETAQAAPVVETASARPAKKTRASA